MDVFGNACVVQWCLCGKVTIFVVIWHRFMAYFFGCGRTGYEKSRRTRYVRQLVRGRGSLLSCETAEERLDLTGHDVFGVDLQDLFAVFQSVVVLVFLQGIPCQILKAFQLG